MASPPGPGKAARDSSEPNTERTPLLSADNVAKSVNTIADDNQDAGVLPLGPHEEDEDKPMPYRQVILLCFVTLVDPVSYFIIFPIIGAMLVEVAGLPVKNIGLWAGLIETMFSAVQVLVMIAYGKVSDRIGRKPVLVFSMVGIAISQALFGLSQNLWQMMVLRCVNGFFAGSSVCVRAMLSEITTKKTQARAFSWYAFSKNIGIFIGPLIGSVESCVAERGHPC